MKFIHLFLSFYFLVITPLVASLSGLIHHNGVPTDELQKVLAITGVEKDLCGSDLVNATQLSWLRSKNLERYQVEQKKHAKHDELIPSFKALKMIDEIKPTSKHYDCVVVHGASLETFRTRIAYLINLYNEGIRFDKVVILTGMRLLFPTEPRSALASANLPFIISKSWVDNPANPFTTEADMARLIWDQAEMPSEMKLIPTHIIVAPTNNGVRPNTRDTINYWLKQEPAKLKKVLAVSNQPYIIYQDDLLRYSLPSGTHLETVGFGCLSQEVESMLVLDSLARVLYVWKEQALDNKKASGD